MARATTPTKLSLTRWAQILGIHPLHFEQVTLPEMPPTVCAQPWIQHSWQSADRVGREELAIAIRTAEDNIERILHSRLMPSWEVDEWQPTERYFRPELTNLGSTDIRGYNQLGQAMWRHFITGGIQAKTLIGTSAIVWSDSDSDGYKETGTTTIAVTFPDECEVYAYYPGKSGRDEWEIRPINVDINSGTGIATITFRRELTVKESLLEEWDPSDVDGTDDNNFLTNVDIYRKYNDPQQQVQFLWEPKGGCTVCGGSGCPECSYSTQYGCLLIRSDPRYSMVVYKPAEWNSETLEFDSATWAVARQPDLLRLWYYAGIRDKRVNCSVRNMSPDWERAVAYYAAALLDRPVCECNNVGAYIRHWRRDLSIAGEGEEEAASIDFDLLGNPFGTKRGAVYAWQQVQNAREIVQEIAM